MLKERVTGGCRLAKPFYLAWFFRLKKQLNLCAIATCSVRPWFYGYCYTVTLYRRDRVLWLNLIISRQKVYRLLSCTKSGCISHCVAYDMYSRTHSKLHQDCCTYVPLYRCNVSTFRCMHVHASIALPSWAHGWWRRCWSKYPILLCSETVVKFSPSFLFHAQCSVC